MRDIHLRSTQGTWALLVAGLLALALLAPAVVLAQEPVGDPSATASAPGSEFKWSWGNTVSYGLGFRLHDPDPRLIGLAAGGTAYSVNGDDGIQNYEKGIFTNAVKLTSELQWSYKGFGGFVRGFGFYDYENETADRARTPLSPASSSGDCRASCARVTRPSTGARAPSSRAASTRSTRST
jgi:hypothetical protein